jgi:hypothetical protein
MLAGVGVTSRLGTAIVVITGSDAMAVIVVESVAIAVIVTGVDIVTTSVCVEAKIAVSIRLVAALAVWDTVSVNVLGRNQFRYGD